MTKAAKAKTAGRDKQAEPHVCRVLRLRFVGPHNAPRARMVADEWGLCKQVTGR